PSLHTMGFFEKNLVAQYPYSARWRMASTSLTRSTASAPISANTAARSRKAWLGLGVDVKGSIYEGLLERNAQEVKSGAGQYLHAARADRRDGDRGRPRAAGNGSRPGLRHRRLSARGVGAHA